MVPEEKVSIRKAAATVLDESDFHSLPLRSGDRQLMTGTLQTLPPRWQNLWITNRSSRSHDLTRIAM